MKIDRWHARRLPFDHSFSDRLISVFRECRNTDSEPAYAFFKQQRNSFSRDFSLFFCTPEVYKKFYTLYFVPVCWHNLLWCSFFRLMIHDYNWYTYSYYVWRCLINVNNTKCRYKNKSARMQYYLCACMCVVYVYMCMCARARACTSVCIYDCITLHNYLML